MFVCRPEDEQLPCLPGVLGHQALQQLLPQRHEGMPGIPHRDPGAVGPVCW